MRRLVEAELFLKPFDEFRIKPLRAAIFRRASAATGLGLSGICPLPGIAAAGNTLGAVAALARSVAQ